MGDNNQFPNQLPNYLSGKVDAAEEPMWQALKTSWVTRPTCPLDALRERVPEPMRAKIAGVFTHPKDYVVEYASGDITVIPAATWDDDTTVARICLECP